MTIHLLRGIIEGSRDLVAAIAADFTVLAFNRAYGEEFRRVFGRDLSIGSDLRGVLADLPEERNAAIALWSRALAGEAFSVEQEFGDPLRTLYQISFTPLFAPDGGIAGAVQYVRDGFERGRAMADVRRLNEELVRRVAQQTAALRDSHERFQSTFEHAPVGIAHLDLDGGWLTMNRRLIEISGYDETELKALSLAALTHPDDRAAERAQTCRLVERQIVGYRLEQRYLRKDGSVVWVLVTATIVGATRPYVLVIVEDISEAKDAELALRASEAEQRRLAAEAMAAKSHADRANAAKTRFLAAASHDLRQPAQSLSLFASVLEHRLAGTPEEAVVVRITQSIDGLRSLLDSLLDISKLDAGVVVPQVVDLAADDLLARLAAEYSAKAAAAGLRFRHVRSRAWIRTDPALAERILRNLLENAIRYTPNGAVLLGCRHRQGGLAIEVRDTGIGIAEDQADAVFEEFHQVGNSERDRSQGLGLGLAIVRRLAQLLGHDVTLRSTLGGGSCFSVMLTRAEPPAAQPEAARSQAGPRGRTIVVVDDEDLMRAGLALMLESWGFTVVTAGSGTEAVAAVSALTAPPDVILADYRLRDGEIGTEVVKGLRGLLGRRIPALILTGDTAPERIAEANSSSVSILHKPVATDDLKSALTKLM